MIINMVNWSPHSEHALVKFFAAQPPSHCLTLPQPERTFFLNWISKTISGPNQILKALKFSYQDFQIQYCQIKLHPPLQCHLLHLLNTLLHLLACLVSVGPDVKDFYCESAVKVKVIIDESVLPLEQPTWTNLGHQPF